MGKFWILLLGSLSLHTGAFAFEKLPSIYQIPFGNPKAPIRIVEYFSLSCPKCIDSYKKDFKPLRQKYVNSEEVLWTFHPHPADLLTLQAMVCLEKLSWLEKRIFLETLMENLDGKIEGDQLLLLIMDTLGKPISNLDQPANLKNSAVFEFAQDFLKQKDVVQDFPTVEINGRVYDDFPSKKFIEKTLSALITDKKESQ